MISNLKLKLIGLSTTIALALCAMPVTASSAAAASFTWSGAEPVANWSDGGNWGGVVPSCSVETLTFPELTSAACSAHTATCQSARPEPWNSTTNGRQVHAEHRAIRWVLV